MIQTFLKLATIIIVLTSSIYSIGIDKTFTSDGKATDNILSFLGFNTKGYNKSYALVIGISKYNNESDFQELPTKNDPIRMKDYLINQAGFEYVHLLTEDKVTLSRVQKLMSEVFPNKIKGNDRFLFYWSGHGISCKLPTGGYRGYLPLPVTRNSKAYSTMISMNNIKEWDMRLNVKQTLYLLDSCFSGLAGIVAQGSTHRELSIEQLAQSSRQILSAGTGNQSTIASDKLGGSIFTSALLDGLNGGKADRFGNDGIVSISELKLYILSYIKSKKGNWKKIITPQLRDLDVNKGEFFFFTTPSNIKIKKIENTHFISKGTSYNSFDKLKEKAKKYYKYKLGTQLYVGGKLFTIGQIIKGNNSGLNIKYKNKNLILQDELGIIINKITESNDLSILWMKQKFCITKDTYSCSNEYIKIKPFLSRINSRYIVDY